MTAQKSWRIQMPSHAAAKCRATRAVSLAVETLSSVDVVVMVKLRGQPAGSATGIGGGSFDAQARQAKITRPLIRSAPRNSHTRLSTTTRDTNPVLFTGR